MSRKYIVCFGDSNTHGYDVETDGRFNEEERWPCILQELLGNEYRIIEEGLSGRTTVFDDPFNEGLNGIRSIGPCLMTHEPIDLLIIMLGTNDTKERFGVSGECIGLGLRRLIKKAETIECWKDRPNILIIAPPPIKKQYANQVFGSTMGKGCSEKSYQLPKVFEQVSDELGYYFIDASEYIKTSKIDSVHLTREGHKILAKTLSKIVPDL